MIIRVHSFLLFSIRCTGVGNTYQLQPAAVYYCNIPDNGVLSIHVHPILPVSKQEPSR